MTVTQFFSLVHTQAKMSLKAEASRLYFSYLWWILEPILYVIVFYFVFEVILNFGRENFLLFLMCGKIPFLWFTKSITAASNSIIQNKGIISQTNIPKILFPYTSLHESLYKQWAVFLVLLSIVIAYGFFPNLNWLWLLPLVFTQYLLILLCSLIGAFLVCFIPDMRIIISMGLTFLLFVSGIFWDINTIQDASLRDLIFIINPLAFLLDGYRAVLIQQTIYDLEHLFLLCLICVTILTLTHCLFFRMNKVIAAKVINS